jgi:transposase
MSDLPLTPRQRLQLERQLRDTADAGVFRRTLALLEVAQGRPVSQVARLLRTSRVSIYHWLRRYRQTATASCLLDHRGGNNPTLWSPELQSAFQATLTHRPDHFGYPALNWTIGLLAEHLTRWWGHSVSATTIRRQLHRLDYVWKRPRYVLQPDPERDKKTADSRPPAATAAAHRETVRG